MVVKILGISGSARRRSFNSALLLAAKDLVPQGATLELYEASRLPMFNQDLEKDMPQVAREFKALVKASDAVLFATPEYNYSVSALLKNAIEWGNRPAVDNSWDGNRRQ